MKTLNKTAVEPTWEVLVVVNTPRILGLKNYFQGISVRFLATPQPPLTSAQSLIWRMDVKACVYLCLSLPEKPWRRGAGGAVWVFYVFWSIQTFWSLYNQRNNSNEMLWNVLFHPNNIYFLLSFLLFISFSNKKRLCLRFKPIEKQLSEIISFSIVLFRAWEKEMCDDNILSGYLKGTVDHMYPWNNLNRNVSKTLLLECPTESYTSYIFWIYNDITLNSSR